MQESIAISMYHRIYGSIFALSKRAEYCIWNASSSNCWICHDFHLLSLSRKDTTSPERMKVSEFLPCAEVDVSLKVIITIFTHDIRLKLFWYNLFKSYQLSETKCQIFSRVMVAVFAPFSYPFFDIVSLVKYTQQKLQLNAFLANEKDLGRFDNLGIPLCCKISMKVIEFAQYKISKFPWRNSRKGFNQDLSNFLIHLFTTKMNGQWLLAQKIQCNSCFNWVFHIMNFYSPILGISGNHLIHFEKKIIMISCGTI